MNEQSNTTSRFGHDADPARDFELEVMRLSAGVFNLAHGLSGPNGEAPPPIEKLSEDIDRALMFKVGGVPAAVEAKAVLRDLRSNVDEALQILRRGVA